MSSMADGASVATCDTGETPVLLAWIDSRVPAPPESLRIRLREIVTTRAAERAANGSPADASIADALISGAEWLLARLLSDACLTRGSAVDLLAADALITYAFEASSDEPATIEARAARAMARLSALVA